MNGENKFFRRVSEPYHTSTPILKISLFLLAELFIYDTIISIQGAMMESIEIESLIGEISLFGGVDRSYVDRIIPRCEVVLKSEGELVYHENDPASEIYIILSGKIKLVSNIEEDPYELIELSAGHTLGETSLIGIEPHGSTAIVTENVTLLVLSRANLSKIHLEEPEVFTVLILNIARELARRLHRNRKTLSDIRRLIRH